MTNTRIVPLYYYVIKSLITFIMFFPMDEF